MTYLQVIFGAAMHLIGAFCVSRLQLAGCCVSISMSRFVHKYWPLTKVWQSTVTKSSWNEKFVKKITDISSVKKGTSFSNVFSSNVDSSISNCSSTIWQELANKTRIARDDFHVIFLHILQLKMSKKNFPCLCFLFAFSQ